MTGPVFTPGDEGFADEAFAWKTTITHTPDVVVGATSSFDVLAAVRFARDNGMTVEVQATGHGAQGNVGRGMLIVTRRMDSVTVDAATRTATVGAGAQWAAVIAAAAPAGLAPIPGSSGTVGVVGYLVGGGLGPLARSHGFSSDFVTGMTVVTGAGNLVEATADENPDLFWALRGGKEGLGIVTQVRLRLVELASLYGGSLTFEGDAIEPALRAWVDFTATAPDDVSTSVAILRIPDIDQVPPPLRGRTLLSLRFAYPGDAATGESYAAPLRAAAPLFSDDLAEIPAAAIASVHSDPPDPGPSWTRGRLLTSFDQDAASVVLAHAGATAQTPLLGVEIRHLGGATRGDVDGGSAVGGRDNGFTLVLIGAPNPALFDEVLPAVSSALFADLDRWISPSTTINFAGHYESPEHYASAWTPETFARLASVRERYNPDSTLPNGVRVS